MISTQVVENGKKKTVTIASLLTKHNGFIYRVCLDWLPNFRYDESIALEDLAQELKEKFLRDLYKYDCSVRAEILPYMSAIAKNFFLSKKNKVMLNHLHPINANGTFEPILPLHSKISNGETKLTLTEVLKSNDESQENKVYYEDLIKKIQEELDEVIYKPHDFTKRLRSFTRTVFDTLLNKKEDFSRFILFDHRCCIRASLRRKKTVPRTILIKASTMGRYLGVDERTINLAYSIIRKVIKDEIMKKVG